MEAVQATIPDMIRDLANRNEEIRWAAASALARTGRDAVEPLMAALTHPDSVVRLRAAWALGHIGDPRAIPKLIRILSDGDWSVRMRAADALGEMKASGATEALLLLLRDPMPDVRRHAISALTRIADPDSVDRIGPSLRDRDWRVRMGAALALAAIGNDRAAEYLRSAACDENEYVRTVVRSAGGGAGAVICGQNYELGPAKDLPEGTMRAYTAGGRELLLARIGGGVYAINNTCTHQGCRLSNGKLEDGIVKCACHGSAFDLKTGKVIRGPAKSPESVYGITIANDVLNVTF